MLLSVRFDDGNEIYHKHLVRHLVRMFKHEVFLKTDTTEMNFKIRLHKLNVVLREEIYV
jgi:hypothetical protein